VEKAYAKQDPLERDFSPSLQKSVVKKGKTKRKAWPTGKKKVLRIFGEYLCVVKR